MNNTSRRFFIYARKSTEGDDRQARSIEDQLAEVRELARKNDLQIVDVLREQRSAKTPGRPVFNAMLERIEKGEADGILAWHPDRLARNMLDGGRIIHLVDAGIIRDMKFPNVDFQPTSQGKLTLAFMFGMSKYYVDALSENIRRGQRQKVLSGVFPQQAPLGYLNDTKTRTIYVDENKAPFIRKAFELYATGNYTFAQIHEVVNGMGLIGRRGGLLAVSNYQYMLKNPVYYGLIRFHGELHEGKHPPLITKSLFDKCQEVMRRKSKPKTATLKPYLYRGLFRCGECGCFITTETQKGHNYLRCTKRVKKDCSQRFVREEDIMKQINAALSHVALPPEWADSMIAELEAESQGETHAARKIVASIERDIEAVDEKLQRLMDIYLDKAISAIEYRETRNGLIEQKKLLEEKKGKAERNRSGWFEPAIRFVKEAKTGGILAETDDEAKKRDFFKKTGSNLQLADRTLRWEPRGAWQIIVDSGRFAQHETPAPLTGADAVGETDQISMQRGGGDTS